MIRVWAGSDELNKEVKEWFKHVRFLFYPRNNVTDQWKKFKQVEPEEVLVEVTTKKGHLARTVACVEDRQDLMSWMKEVGIRIQEI